MTHDSFHHRNVRLETPWTMDHASLLKELQTDLTHGLSKEEVHRRVEIYGSNVLRTQEKTPAWKHFLVQFKSPIVVTLLIAAVVSIFFGDLVDAIAIFSIVILNALIGFLQEAKAEKAVEALIKLASPKARVFRSANIIEISAEDIVPGDLLLFEAGDYVAADARVLEANQLSIDESILTGESLPVNKSTDVVEVSKPLADRSNMIFAGTAVSTGSGRALVTSTGMNTEIGQIAAMMESTETELTPLHLSLNQVGSKLLLLCLVLVTFVSILGLIRGENWLSVLMTGISLAVASIPEGLPAIVTLALALAIHRLAKRNAIIRQLPAVETLGSTDVICTDKTGTLTTGKMRVREVVTPEGLVFSSETSISDPSVEMLISSATLCSNASLNNDGQATGDPTEVALLYLARDQGRDPSSIHKNSKRLCEWSFESVRKRMSVAVAESEHILIHIKGAPESILPLCHLKNEDRQRILDALQQLSSKGRRMLAVARRTLSTKIEHFRKEDYLDTSKVEQDLIFLGLVAIADPPRMESIEAIRKCKASGIRVVMMTGDHPTTAKVIAEELGIIEKGVFDGVLTGTELDQLDRKHLIEQVAKTAVYARVSPEQKFKIVEAWKSKNCIVAMTGDGVNDAPALKAASIGISMGKSGTEVARQASSMILADDNFATIVSAVEEGRAIYGNIRRTIQYLLSGNFAEILIMLGAAIMGWPIPLAPIHLLWINLVTDGLPSLALAGEPVPKDILETSRKPSPKNFFDRSFYKEMAIIGLITSVLALAVFGYSLKYEGELAARTHVFSFLVFAELFRSFASRSETKTFFQLGPFSNVYHLLAVSFPIGFQIILHHMVWFEDLFKVRLISWSECVFFIALALVPVTILEIRKTLTAISASKETKA